MKLSEIDERTEMPLKKMIKVGNLNRAFTFAKLPHAGIGLARLEFIIKKMIGIHPKALLKFDEQSADLQEEINEIIAGYSSPVEFYIAKLTEGISTLAAAY